MAPPRRPTPAVYRRRRLAAFSIFAALVVILVVVATSGSSSHRRSTKTTVAGTTAARLVVSLSPWQLASPLSRSVALAVDGNIDLFGGLTGTGQASTAAVTQVSPATGAASQVATLPDQVHDAAGAAIGSRYFVFGGGASSVSAAVQSFTPDDVGPPTAVAARLPTPRADLASATSPDGTVYLAGGYDGTNASAAVLATRDGTTFQSISNLPVPVRYPAVTIAGGDLVVVGGSAGGSSSAPDSDVIQIVDVKTGHASIAGHLPVPIDAATAATLGGAVYVFGGRSGGHVLDTVYKLSAGRFGWTAAPDGSLPIPTANMAVTTLGQTAYLIGGEGQLGQPLRSVIVARISSATVASTESAPFQGKLLIADRGNDRLLLVNAQKQILWTFPSAAHPAPAEGFYFPDDAFFVDNGTAIITNQEDQNTIEEIAYPSGQLVASYGHANQAGSSPGYLNQPDDAYILNNGVVTVADAKNCRILFLNPNFTYLSAIGHTGNCHHDIPRDVAYPNGDTPLADGNFLVSEIIGSWVDEVTMSGQVVWSLQLPIAYPSDPQQLGPDLYLLADYTTPGQLIEFTREGQIVWRYDVTSGEGMLDHPSLAERLPNGLICVNDDYRHRVVIIDPKSERIVWQYGDTDTAGTAPGLLNTPDGFDLLLPNGTTPTHLAASGPATGAGSTPTSAARVP